MPGPTLQDDGSQVTLDLHGIYVDEALRLARALIVEAARRGRHTVRLIHGASTSSTLYRNRTIKHELQSMLDDSAVSRLVAARWQDEGYLLLALVTSGTVDRSRIILSDLPR